MKIEELSRTARLERQREWRKGGLSPSQVWALAWAARPGEDRPPLGVFGVDSGRRLLEPRCDGRTWRSLILRGLVATNERTYKYEATHAGREWLEARGMLEYAMAGVEVEAS